MRYFKHATAGINARRLDRQKTRYLSVSILSLCFLLPFISGCGNDSEPAAGNRPNRNKAVPVVAYPATIETLRERISAIGTARALHSVTVFPESDGIVTEINFNANSPVKAGDVLMALDARDEQLALQLAKVRLADAQRLLDRYTSVNQRSSNIPESEVDAAKLALEAARIAVDTAEVTLARRFIRAPFDGHVGITDIDVGDRVDANTMITTIDDRSTLLVNFSVPESFISQVTPGMTVSARLWESAQPAIQARVVAIDSRVNATSRAFVTQAGIDNSNDRLRPGMAFEMSLALSRGDYLAVPDVAVQWGADGAYLWVAASGDAAVQANNAERVEIQIIKRLGSALLIEADIAVGTLVIAEGVQSVRQGVALRLLDPSTLDGDARLELALPSVSNSADATPNG